MNRPLFLMLFLSAAIGVPHLICAYQYHIAVSEAGESGEDVVFDLGE